MKERIMEFNILVLLFPDVSKPHMIIDFNDKWLDLR